ncbi:MAG: mandelate racemase/muconate lactonizing enzyme family protein [Phycisphaerae bacterium]
MSLSRFARADSAVPPADRVVKVETFPVSYPTVARFKFLEGPRGERRGRQSLVVKITAEDGAVGWGQCVPSHRWSYETIETVQTTVERYLTPVLLGMNAFDVDAIHAAMNRMIAPSFSTGQPIAKAGIDLALWDLIGRRLNRNVGTLIREGSPPFQGGGPGSGVRPLRDRAASERPRSTSDGVSDKGRDRITLSWTLNPKTLDEVPVLIDEGRKRGYRNFNVKVAPDPKFDVALCRIVRTLVPEGFLWADANGGYDESTALAVAPKLAEIGVPVLEQPLPANRLTGYRRLRKQHALPILMDEGIVNSVELEEFIRLELLDGIAVKPARCGGLTDARRQIELCREHGLMWLGSGLTDPDISLAASLALFGAYDYRYPAALNGPQFLADRSILARPLRPEDDQLAVPRGAGLGVEVDEAKIAQYRDRHPSD